MFIDIHVHGRRVPGPPRNVGGLVGGGVYASGKTARVEKQAYATPEQLIARYDALGIEKGVLLPRISPECVHIPQTSQEVMDICESFPGRFIPYCNVDPRAMWNAPDAPLNELLGWYKDHGFKGCGEVSCNLAFNDPLVLNLFKHLQDVDLPISFHMAPEIGRYCGLVDERGLPLFESALRRFSKLKFFAHSQPFWAEIGRLEKPGDRYGYPAYPIREEGAVPKLFRQYGNLYGDLSGGSGCNALKRDPDYAVKFLNEFQDRLFFGTDIAAPDTPTPLVDFLLGLRDSGRISAAVFAKIARENAIRVLEL